MKHFNETKPRGALMIVAIASMLSLGVAHAAGGGSVWIGDQKFADSIANAGPATPNVFENGQYEKLNLSVIGESIWVPKSNGVQGPVRLDPEARQAIDLQQAADRILQRSLWPVGGAGTA